MDPPPKAAQRRKAAAAAIMLGTNPSCWHVLVLSVGRHVPLSTQGRCSITQSGRRQGFRDGCPPSVFGNGWILGTKLDSAVRCGGAGLSEFEHGAHRPSPPTHTFDEASQEDEEEEEEEVDEREVHKEIDAKIRASMHPSSSLSMTPSPPRRHRRAASLPTNMLGRRPVRRGMISSP